MNDLSEIKRETDGDWQVRGIVARGYDLMFAPDELSDSAITAASWAQARFNSPFPGWEAYRVVINGDPRLHGLLIEYATGVGLALLESPKVPVRRKGAWVVQASQDAMGKAICGSFPAAASWRADEYDVSDKTYARVRAAIAREYTSAIEDFRGTLWSMAERVLRIDSKFR